MQFLFSKYLERCVYRGCWVERSETQKIERRMLGFVPQPNLQLMLIFNAIFIFKIS
jgi:hypothetical protein